MGSAACTDDEFIEMFRSEGPHKTAQLLGVAVTNVFARRRRIEERTGKQISPPVGPGSIPRTSIVYPQRLSISQKDGVIIIGSDAHYWPEEVSCAHRALLFLCRELQPKVVIMNGDLIDGARISRHPPIGWSSKPTVKAELACVEERLTEIEDAARKSQKIWTLGNHDLRFENRLAAQTPEYEGIGGFCLKDQFPRWQHVVSTWINNNCVVKHRFKGGIHATHNNTLWAGKTMVTGHLHSLKVTPLTDYNGTRYGVDTGTLAEPSGEQQAGPQFDYNEDNPQNHRSGFAILTFHKGALLWPEVARVVDSSSFEFRGRVVTI